MTAFGRAVPRGQAIRLSASAADMARRLARVESRNVTFLDPPPPFWTDALGCNVRDSDGNVYLDFTGAFGVAFAGHRHPHIVFRITDQSSRLIHGMGDVHPPAVKLELLESLAGLLPWPEPRIILGGSGSDAVEAALKTAQLASGRTGIIAFEGSYHGLSLGALATTGRAHFREPFTQRLTPHVHFLPYPTSPDQVDQAIAAAVQCMDEADPTIGTVIVEPIQGRAGVRTPPPGFVARLAREAHRSGALLVADEVFTGMGRTGRLLASEHEGVIPDIVCLGKALGGGLPLSACCASSEVMDAWPPSSGEAIHTSTFLGHPLGCAAALGFIEVLGQEGLADRAEALGRSALEYLTGRLADLGAVAQIHGRGLMLGVELDAGAGGRVARAALERGVLVLPAGDEGQVVALTPPATITTEQLERGLDILVSVMRSAS